MQRPDMLEFYQEITSPQMDLISRHLNFVSRKHFNDGPEGISPKLFKALERLPAL